MVLLGMLMPFIGTSLGAGCVIFVNSKINARVERYLLSFAGGVMVAASVWSLLIPAMEQCAFMGKLAFLPAVVGLTLGVVLLPAVDKLTPRLKLSKTHLLVLAVTVHNIPEGMAVGVALAGAMNKACSVTIADALVLSLGVAIQNFPEGAIVSMPVKASGRDKWRAFLIGVASGAVEPVAAVFTFLAFSLVTPLLPYLLAFAAGAMIYVVIEELVPQAALGSHNSLTTFAFAFGFCIMMTLDVLFG